MKLFNNILDDIKNELINCAVNGDNSITSNEQIKNIFNFAKENIKLATDEKGNIHTEFRLQF